MQDEKPKMALNFCFNSISFILNRTSWKVPSTSLSLIDDCKNHILWPCSLPLDSSKFKSYCSYSGPAVLKDKHNHKDWFRKLRQHLILTSTFPMRWFDIEQTFLSAFRVPVNHMLPCTNASIYTCILSFLFSVSAAHGYECEGVANYYAPVSHSHLEGEDLKKELNSIISPHHSLSYKEVWDALKILDAADVDNPDASSGVVEIYSLKVVPKTLAGKPQGWNREHLWPRSYGLVNRPSRNDLHNIRPSDVNVNSSRGNKFYGECAFYSTKCVRPANREAAMDTESDKERWTPPRKVRGDIARSLMYMAVCYGFRVDGGPYLQLSDSPRAESREMGLLSTLLRWNQIDPPSREEQLRNNRICKFYQHNRNPFIDHPEYANLIWKQNTGMKSTFHVTTR